MLVERELAIRHFVPENYMEVVATFSPLDTAGTGSRTATTRSVHSHSTGAISNSDSGSQPASSCNSQSGIHYQGTYFRPDLEPSAGSAPGSRSQGRDATQQVAAEGSRGASDRASPAKTPGAAPRQNASREDLEAAAERRRHARRLPADGEEAARIVERALRGRAEVQSVEGRQRQLPPPLLYDLTELQRHANRLFAFSANKTLELAQSLYERKKLISYPRSDSRHLSKDVARELPATLQRIRQRYDSSLIAPGTGERALGRRFVDDERVADHHALIPTSVDATSKSLSQDEERIYDLICRRLLAAWHQDHLYSTTRVVTTISDLLETAAGRERVVDHYESNGTKVDREGWKVLDIKTRGDASPTAKGGRSAHGRGHGRSVSGAVPGAAAVGEPDQQLPPSLRESQRQRVLDARAMEKRTRPPRRFNEANLLTAMETAGKKLDDKELSDAMRESGLGTPATRAAIIETLLQREYIRRDKKSLIATEKGIQLIDLVHPDVKSPAMTGQWEARLQGIHRGEGRLDAFMGQIEAWLRDIVGRVLAGGVAAAPPASAAARPPGSAPGPDEALPPISAYAAHEGGIPAPGPAMRGLPVGEGPLGRSPTPLRLRRLPAPPAERVRGGHPGRRRAAGDADGRWQIALLSAAGGRPGGNDPGHQPADRTDGRPGGEASGDGLPGRAHPLGPLTRGLATGVRRIFEGHPRFPLDRARAPQCAGLPRDAGQASPGADRCR
jgi:DNA topoisomerase-3